MRKFFIRFWRLFQSGNSSLPSLGVRPATVDDLPVVMSIFDHARSLMRAGGNFTQWTDGYPSESLIREEIGLGRSFVCTNEAGEPVGVFSFILGEDPTYLVIEDGHWLNDLPYGVIHRMATAGKQRGVADACLRWCASRCDNLRVDTHRDNAAMLHILEKHGFRRCGIIYVRDGTPRIAFQRYMPSDTLSAPI